MDKQWIYFDGLWSWQTRPDGDLTALGNGERVYIIEYDEAPIGLIQVKDVDGELHYKVYNRQLDLLGQIPIEEVTSVKGWVCECFENNQIVTGS